jgi:hypothetical protein
MIAHPRLGTGHPLASDLLLRAMAAGLALVVILGLLPLMAGAAA